MLTPPDEATPASTKRRRPLALTSPCQGWVCDCPGCVEWATAFLEKLAAPETGNVIAPSADDDDDALDRAVAWDGPI
jgi:hypothetical protein